MVVTAAGYVLGNAIGDHPFGLHLPGSLFGISNPPAAGWVATWCVFNLVAYAVIPYLAFRSRGYTNEQLNLRSSDRGADLRLILVILVVESILEFAALGGRLLALPGVDAARAIPLSFTVNLVGTYALIHVFDGWALYSDLSTAVLTVSFLVLQYFGPGLIKAVLTQRTGNTWVHVWGYHAVAPHATVDAPSVVHLLHTR